MKLVDFLTKIVSNPGWTKRFCEDPQGTIDSASLDEASRAAIKSGDPKKVAGVICVGTSRYDPVD